jgi:ribosomal-protein-alanine N-acetyltransferase
MYTAITFESGNTKVTMELQSVRLTLRELLLNDLEKIHELHSLQETDEYNTLGIPDNLEVTKQLVSEWLDTQREFDRRKYVLCIENREKSFIGLIGINIGKPKYKNAEIWFKLHSQFWNMGYATEAVTKVLHFCFLELKLHRIEAGCAVDNLASKRVLEKVGMTREGLRRKALPIRDRWSDNYQFGILHTDLDRN